jgi:hypothetical protein
MTDKARQYKPSTVKRLHTLSGNQCAAPNCDRPLIARDGRTIVSKICHIEAFGKNGPRYNPYMTDDDRRHFDNLILLCDECHSIIDNKENENNYSVSLLKEWKKNHEGKRINQLSLNPSLLKLAIDAIAKAEFNGNYDKDDRKLQPFDIADKINYNAIKRNKSLINEYKIYYNKINSLYDELEIQGSFKKEKLLRNIKLLYVKIKGSYVKNSDNPMQLICDNADNIIEDILDKLLEEAEKDKKKFIEDITFGISVIMVDAFMRCKILEEPEKK